jgi:transcriptional regulator with XRE-family HTH domain
VQYPKWWMSQSVGIAHTLCCMAGNTPSAKARALGAAIKRARVEHDVGLRDLARRVGLNPGLLSHWENGTRSPKAVEIDRILNELGVHGVRREDILELTRDTDAPQWIALTLPDQRQHLNALMQFQRDASDIIEVVPIVPGLLQTEAYVRAIMTAGGIPEDEIETRILIRLGHQRILNTVRLTALIGEAALHQEVGGRAVLGEQLRHLIDMAKHENVTIQVVPFTAGWMPLHESAWTMIRSENASTLVALENRISGRILHREDHVSAYEEAVKSVSEVAMSPQASAELIAEKIKQLETKRHDDHTREVP